MAASRRIAARTMTRGFLRLRVMTLVYAEGGAIDRGADAPGADRSVGATAWGLVDMAVEHFGDLANLDGQWGELFGEMDCTPSERAFSGS